jgi:hypothetical protein
VAVVKADPPDQVDGIRTGNILLRDYFLERYLELHSDASLFPGSVDPGLRAKQPPDPMAEVFVNSQVEQFIKDLEQKLGAMKSTVNQLETVRQDAMSDRVTGDPSTRARVRELADDVGDRAGDLYRMVSAVVIDLHPKDDLVAPPSSGTDFLGAEVGFLRKLVGKAEGRLKALFLQPTHTVDLDELRGDNVLTELKSIEQVSKDIKKKAAVPAGHTDMVE